jgi:hypothetical protein
MYYPKSQIKSELYTNGNEYTLIPFPNNYNADLPSGLIPILKKIIKFASDEGLYSSEAADIEDIQ